MTFVVTESCIKCKLTDCVEVCPVDCFHEGPNFLVIDPEECIDCTLCEPEVARLRPSIPKTSCRRVRRIFWRSMQNCPKLGPSLPKRKTHQPTQTIGGK